MNVENLSPFIIFDAAYKNQNGHKPHPEDIVDDDIDIVTFRANRLLRGISDRELFQILKGGETVTFKQDEQVTHQSTPVTSVLFILEGRARAEVSGPTQSSLRAVVDFLRPGDDIGLLSVVDGAPHSATVIALDDIKAISVPVLTLRTYLSNHEEWYRTLAEIAVERLRTSSVWLQAFM